MNKRLTLLLVLGLAIAAIVGYVIYKRFSGFANDEAPIIVKNGSMTVEIRQGAWVNGGTHWGHVTGNQSDDDLWVQIDLTSGPCPVISGNQVHIDYSGGGPQTTFHASNTGTRLTPRSEFAQETPDRLRRGSSDDGGHITGVRAGSQQGCQITQQTLRVICIWTNPDFDPARCQ